MIIIIGIISRPCQINPCWWWLGRRVVARLEHHWHSWWCSTLSTTYTTLNKGRKGSWLLRYECGAVASQIFHWQLMSIFNAPQFNQSSLAMIRRPLSPHPLNCVWSWPDTSPPPPYLHCSLKETEKITISAPIRRKSVCAWYDENV